MPVAQTSRMSTCHRLARQVLNLVLSQQSVNRSSSGHCLSKSAVIPNRISHRQKVKYPTRQRPVCPQGEHRVTFPMVETEEILPTCLLCKNTTLSLARFSCPMSSSRIGRSVAIGPSQVRKRESRQKTHLASALQRSS